MRKQRSPLITTRQRSAISDSSKPAAPSPECCKALAKADLRCLCSYKNSPLLRTLGIDPELAVKLPPKCNLKTPANC
ncbi:hypothetical protein Cni_G23783 [Canna indica]|uniref:Bifunctional inhibitor/plant lipid transfer protein/seed storage helical domain-containing protein n=1 Tax=Canna indica TaxID=4628 RepID=A0AAQ3L0Y7_9LILI|nr:hypothetical protein Cni_G23783 [Canna indica]